MGDALSKRWRSILACVLLVAVLVISVVWSIDAGAPKKLPSVALGSAALLYLIRAVVATALIGLVGLVLVRGFAGRWPLEVSTTGIKYAEAVADLTKVEQDIAILQAIAEDHDERLRYVGA